MWNLKIVQLLVKMCPLYAAINLIIALKGNKMINFQNKRFSLFAGFYLLSKHDFTNKSHGIRSEIFLHNSSPSYHDYPLSCEFFILLIKSQNKSFFFFRGYFLKFLNETKYYNVKPASFITFCPQKCAVTYSRVVSVSTELYNILYIFKHFF